MSKVGQADRERFLQLKRGQLTDVVTTRKRKLRELYQITNATAANISVTSFTQPPTTPGEGKFLEECDILQGKLFDEAKLPDLSRKAARLQRDGSRTERYRATSPGSRSDAGQRMAEVESARDGNAQSTSAASQTGLPVDKTLATDATTEEKEPPDVLPPSALESERVQALASPLNSPGADPKKFMPILAEDAARLEEPLVAGFGSHDEHHQAATVHLPPKEVQEERLRNSRKARERSELTIHLPPREGGRAEPLSSPGSTIDAHSATTPALHDASTDTSPDNESSRYEPDQLDTEDEVETPTQFRKTPEEIAQKEEHDRILKAQIEISSAEILRSSPAGADEQLRNDQAALLAGEQPLGNDTAVNGDNGIQKRTTVDRLTSEAADLVQDVEEDEGENAGAAIEDHVVSKVEESASDPKDLKGKQREVPDSEAEDQSPAADAMDVDSAVKYSFESSTTVDTITVASPSIVETPSAAKSGNNSKKSSVTPFSAIPRRTPSTSAAASPALERMTTRVQSGAMRQKSVTEILGEIPRPNTTPSSERGGLKGNVESDSSSPSRTSTPQSPGTRVRSLAEKAKERERSKLSTVVFPKEKARPVSSNNALTSSGNQPAKDTNGDYFMPLFLATASTEKRGVPSLDNLLQTAHKTITTSNAYIPINENQTSKVLRRIYNLQSSGKWSLRQPKRQVEPKRPTSHWDVLLQEARWMRTDFREERKWKMTVAKNLAYACLEWVESSADDRKHLQVNVNPSKPTIADPNSPKDVDMADETGEAPDLVASGEIDSLDEFDDEPRLILEDSLAPAAIFALHDDDVVFGLRSSPATDKLLAELPMYGAPLLVPTEVTADSLDPDRFWKQRALPLSKFVEGRIELKSQGPPRKKSRYQYDEEDEDDDVDVFPGLQESKRPILPPEQTDVALFNPEHKHTRDRIHAGHQFRPPSEYVMPLQSFFENRTASQWTLPEDDELRSLVREHSYNWSLISSMLTSKSLFSSGAERRTPWECFERWISLEGLPADMQKTQYFRAYNSRLEAANRNVTALAAQAQAQANGQGIVQTPRRRPTISFRVERRRQQKHLTLVDAMRKLAKKRETSISKQAHASGLAALRRAQEVPVQRAAQHTPQALSKIKFEREERMREQMALYAQRQEQARRTALQARLAGQNPAQALPNAAAPQQRGPNPANSALPSNPNATPTQTNQNLTIPDQGRARGPLPPQMAGQVQMPNGLRAPQPIMNGVPQAQMQTMQGGQLPMPNPALDVGLVARAQNISEQQRQAIRMQQASQLSLQSQNGQIHNSPPRNMNAMSPPNFTQMPNGNMFPMNSNTNGVSSPGPNGQAGSPQMGQPQQLSGGLIPQVARLEENIRQKFPNATQEQVKAMLSDTLNRNVHQRQTGLSAQNAQSAMNAAAGNNMNGMVIGQGMSMNGQNQSPQAYAQMLRQQQEQQQKLQAQAAAQGQQANGGQGHQRNGSGASGN